MNSMTEQTLPILELEELISGSPEAVFDAWTEPEQLKLWFFGGETAMSAWPRPTPGLAANI